VLGFGKLSISEGRTACWVANRSTLTVCPERGWFLPFNPAIDATTWSPARYEDLSRLTLSTFVALLGAMATMLVEVVRALKS
jgi:hypothetical protein